ncbi:Uma2 family endonuclease [Nostoc sp. CMAA1605]|uniref:Uma2 family endonuclease n=1 Tax=Nostoc sp. CMAA1605 TaxID=2055159 RepID=UPI001F3EF7EF|nr:Uma2 family endonuclease [Nostoc sp. CMAA1605]MCF4967817.1 Uma2 family endonuclease [Nostoc sp. CMAA1605]
MSETPTHLPVNTWIPVSWQEYLQTLAELLNVEEKHYYYKGHMRLEMPPVFSDHAQDYMTIIFGISLFTTLKGISATGLDHTTFRKPKLEDCQPDVAYYFQKHPQSVPSGTKIVNLNRYPAPDLVIEIAKSSLLDDLGTKRSLYEDLGVPEYWVVDVQNTQIIPYVMGDKGSKRVHESKVLPGLVMGILEQALRRSRETNQSAIGADLLSYL